MNAMISRKGSRAITVRGRPFRWTVRRKPTYAQAVAMTGFNLAAVLAARRGSTLVVRLPQVHPSNMFEIPSAGVTPAQAADYIAKALDAGWLPEEPGPMFELRVSEAVETR